MPDATSAGGSERTGTAPAIVFADSRKFAEEWTYRFLATALADADTAPGTREATSTLSTGAVRKSG